MFTVTVRDHIMVAHSLRGAVFGPSQRMHGATYVVDAAFRGPQLDADGIVVDIGLAAEQLRAVLADLDRRNLDEDPAFSGRNTTTEVLAREIAGRLADRIAAGTLGGSAHLLTSVTATLHESPVAWASYEQALPPAGHDSAGAP